ncbi:MAG: serine aminopeptidase domain-containing protein [Myxococcales bacterium]
MIRFPARHDGFSLGGDLLLPEGPPKACAVVAGAMAVRAKFYAPFARHLAERGIASLIFDYRGIGASRPDGSLRGFEAWFHDWGEKDIGGAIDLLKGRFPGLPLHFVGHSAGSQLMGLVADAPIASALFVASGTAFWRAYRGRARAFMGTLWYLLIPTFTTVYGYLPMRLVGQGDDVPLGVAREWAKWGKDPRYVFSYAEPRGGLGYTGYKGRLRMLTFEDDSYAPKTAAESLLSLYTNARKELQVRPGPMGHFGFFRNPALWPEQVAWLTGA